MSESAKSLRLLVVEDADDDYRILLREVRRGGYDVTSERVINAAELARALKQPWDLLITDWLLPGFGGLQAIESVVARSDGLPCIVISGTPNEDEAMAAIRAGALDFLSKDRPTRFVPAIERALREAAEYRRRIVSERELRLSEERYRSAFDRAPEALLTFDLDHLKIVDANVAATKLYGRSVDELRTGDFVELSATKLADGRVSLDVATDVLRQMRTGAELAPFEWLVLHKSGEEIPAEVHLVRLAGDQLVRLTVIDLRERRKLEEIRQRTIELELQNRRIQEANRLKSEFLANMSHELRTPLNAIIGFSELLHDGQVPASSPEHQEFLGDILTSGRHLLQLINDVLDLAKVEAGKLDFRPEPVDLTKLVQEMISITRTTAATKRISVEAFVDPSLVDIVLDPGRFKQIAYNYLSNALKFTSENGRVILRCVPADTVEMFRLEVEDNGVGIAPTDLGRLFVEFQQLEQGAAKRHQGTGLGLALSRRLVEAQGGTIGVRSVLGSGSTFHAVLPRQCAILEPTVSRTFTPRNRTGARTILIVEDDDRDRELIASTLAGVGYGFEIARTGADALARCRERYFDAVTLDLLLPDMSGLDVLDTLRVGGWLRDTPVIVVTIVPDVKTAMTVSDILRKPLDRDALLSALERAGVRPGRSQVPLGGGD